MKVPLFYLEDADIVSGVLSLTVFYIVIISYIAYEYMYNK